MSTIIPIPIPYETSCGPATQAEALATFCVYGFVGLFLFPIGLLGLRMCFHLLCRIFRKCTEGIDAIAVELVGFCLLCPLSLICLALLPLCILGLIDMARTP